MHVWGNIAFAWLMLNAALFVLLPRERVLDLARDLLARLKP